MNYLAKKNCSGVDFDELKRIDENLNEHHGSIDEFYPVFLYQFQELLTEKQNKVLELLFQESLSLDEASMELGICKSAIVKIKRRAFHRIANKLANNMFNKRINHEQS